MNVDTTETQVKEVGDKLEAAITEETGKIKRFASGSQTFQTPDAARTEPSKIRVAMTTVDAKGDRDYRAIEALVEQAVAMRVTQVRGKLSFGHADMLARKRALEWIMTIGTDNAEISN